MKKILKKIIITYVLICMLLPTLFMGMVFAEENDVHTLNVERAGNFSANFAINFYDNWSSVSFEMEPGSNTSKGIVNGDYDFVWPLKEGTYSSSSTFGRRVWDDGSVEYHKGIDFASPLGTPVYASAGGSIVDLYNECTHNYPKNSSCGCGGGYGNNIVIDTDSGILMVYGHLTNVESSLKVGDTVAQGQLIGTVGTTGWSTGAHLHFEFDTNEIAGLDDDKIIDRGAPFHGYRYSVDPSLYIGDDAKISVISSGSSKTAKKRGEIKTEYDSQVSPTELVQEELASGEYYKFNNLSWINFVYKNALFKSPLITGVEKEVLTGSGNSASIDLSTFDDKTKISTLKDEDVLSEYLDITKLMSEGKILPGDILYCDNKNGGEYLLYTGGMKVLYATEDKKTYPNGALKYEYIQNYLQRIRRRLREGHEDDENFQVPSYGITQVYRINEATANNISEKSANLFFNGKGYYSYAKYYGIPDKGAFNQTKISNKWSFSFFSQIIEFLINLVVYMIRMQIIGWTNLFENLLQHVIVGMSGNGNISGSETFFGTSATSASGERVTVEGIFFNRIPIFDANFFNINEDDTTSVVFQLRKNLRMWYYIIRNLSIAVLLFGLVYVGIRMALTTIAEKKADYKKMLVTWAFAMCVVLFIHIYMYAVLAFNDITVGMCREFGENAAHEEISKVVDTDDFNEELSLYDAVRVKAYAFNWKEGVPATVIYIFLVYLLVRISLIYFKRYITLYILALSGSFMGVKYAFDRIAGKKTTSLNKWFKDFTFNVLLQTVHALVYVIYMAMALSVSQTSLVGAVVALVLLNFMLKADGILIKIFGLDKAESLADVNKSESWRGIMKKFLPMYTISKNFIGIGSGLVSRPVNFFRYMAFTDADNIKDAQKQLEERKYKRIGALARLIDKTPIRVLSKYSRYHKYNKLMSADLSGDTNKRIYKAIKEAKKLHRQRYTRGIKNFADLSLSAMRKVAAPAIMIADPTAGLVMYRASKSVMDKHRTKSRVMTKADRYGGTVSQARKTRAAAKQKYEQALDTHTNNEYFYQEKMKQLQDDYNNAAPNSEEANSIKRTMDTLEKNRNVERSKEMHTLEETYENYYASQITYGNAKHEKNHKSTIGKAGDKLRHGVGAVTGLNTIEDYVNNDRRERYKAFDKSTKQDDKLKDLEKIVELEKEIKALNKELKQEYNRYGKENNINENDIKSMLDKDRKATIREARDLNVSSANLTRAINEYLYDKNLSKVTDEDVGNVLDRLKDIMADRGKNIDFPDDVKEKVRAQLSERMISDNKGLGYNAKDATKELRKALGKDGVLKSKVKYKTKDDKINSINDKILKKIQELNTYNEVGKVKYKDSLININKIHKDAGK